MHAVSALCEPPAKWKAKKLVLYVPRSPCAATLSMGEALKPGPAAASSGSCVTSPCPAGAVARPPSARTKARGAQAIQLGQGLRQGIDGSSELGGALVLRQGLVGNRQAGVAAQPFGLRVQGLMPSLRAQVIQPGLRAMR